MGREVFIETVRSIEGRIGHGGAPPKQHLRHLHHKREWAFFGARDISRTGGFDPADSHPHPFRVLATRLIDIVDGKQVNGT